jgi:hypothetical protein
MVVNVNGVRLPEGPHFVYDDAPELFLGRRGRGPLDVVWDTNILIDYLTYGPAMWEDEALDVVEDYAAELEGLHLLIQLWLLREVRFKVFARSIDDARRALLEARRGERARAVGEFAAALTLSAYGGDDEKFEPGTVGDALPLWLPSVERDLAVKAVPSGADRELVILALSLGAHVFLTRDRGVLQAADVLRPHGLLVVTPLDLIESLAASGALLCLLNRETTHWPIPDLQRLAHIVQALG